MQQLSHIVVEVLFKLHSGVFDTLIEIFRSINEKTESFSESHNVLLRSGVYRFTFFKSFDG